MTVTSPTVFAALSGASPDGRVGATPCATASDGSAAATARQMNSVRNNLTPISLALRTSAGKIQLYFTRKYTCIFRKVPRMPAVKISGAESQIMEALWRAGPLSPEGVVAEVGAANDWAPGTVKTLITRLLRKKAIEGRREDGGYLYRPLVSRESYVQSESQGLVDRLFGGEVAPLVAHFAEHRALTPKDIQHLKSLIAKLEDDD